MRRILGIALILLAIPSCGSLLVLVPAPGERRFTVVNGTDVALLVTPLQLSGGRWYTLPLVRNLSVQIPYACCADFGLSPGEVREFAYYDSELFPDSLFVVLPDGSSRMQELGLSRLNRIRTLETLAEAPEAAIRAVESERRSFVQAIIHYGFLLLGPLWPLGFITWLMLPKKRQNTPPDSTASNAIQA